VKVIIFGAGEVGKTALYFLGYQRVDCFADNYRGGTSFEGKTVLGYEAMKKCVKDDEYVIVIASGNYSAEIESQLQKDGINRYFIFSESDVWNIESVYPYYYLHKKRMTVPYIKVLANYHLYRYKTIGIYGINKYLPYLLLDILELNKSAEIIVYTEDIDGLPQSICGYPVKLFEMSEIPTECLVINERTDKSDIRSVQDELTKKTDIIDIYAAEDYEDVLHNTNLSRYKDVCKGQRVFIIATGPSLQIEDLNTLYQNNAYCIAVNKIYKSYTKTKWRANITIMVDEYIIEECIDEVKDLEGELFVGDTYHFSRNAYVDGVQYLHFKTEKFYPNYPQFSSDIVKGIYEGYTVVYAALQLAMYMGFSEIYLVGVNHSYSGVVTDKGNHFIENYYSEKMHDKYQEPMRQPHYEEMNLAYEKAKIYAEKHGVKIYNATRGGKLEIFERVCFDKLFD